MNMKNMKIGIWLLVLIFAVFGCSDDKDELITPSLEVGEKQLSFDESTTQKLAIEANGHWTAKVIKDSAQFIVTPEEGYGNGEVTISLNRSKHESINGYLKVTYMDGTDEGLQVAQGVKLQVSKLDVDINPKSASFNSAVFYNEQSFTVNIPGKWTASLSDETCYTLDRTSGEGVGQIKVSMKEGVTAKNKTAELIVVPEAYPLVKYVVTIDESRVYEYDKYIVLNKASIGEGIDVVVMGDFFMPEDLKEGGRWEQAMNIFMTYFFATEPYKSFRPYFNVYAVPAQPSANHDLIFPDDVTEATETIEGPYATYHPGGKFTTNGITSNKPQKEAAYKYAYDHSPVAKEKGTLKDLVVGMLVNTNWRRYGVLAWSNNIDRFENCGMSLTPIPVFGGDLTSMFAHEMLGHGFGDFHENYSSFDEFPAEEVPAFRQQMIDLGINWDCDFTTDPDELINQAWATMYKMHYRNVDIVEGARNFKKGVWRASYATAMRQTIGYYGPVQRELIVRKIYRLAGMENQYNLDVFFEYDKINEESDWRILQEYAGEYTLPWEWTGKKFD